MAKVLYISVFEKTPETLLSNGVAKKINLHLKCLEKYGDQVDYIYTDGKDVFFSENGKESIIAKKDCKNFKYFNKVVVLCKNIIKKQNLSYDFVYIRHVAFSLRGFLALKFISKRSKAVYLEFPTFFIPKRNPKNFVKYFFNPYLHKYIHKAVVDSLDKVAYKMPTLRIINGTDLATIQTREPTFSDTIHVMLVAYIQDYHGIDKIISATDSYYKNGGKRDVIFHIVGDGPALEKNRKLVEEFGLKDRIIFYGPLHGKELDDIFNLCEIGISSLSNKEIGVTCSSTLKSKEYLAKGLPIISDTMLDVFVDNPKYFFYILESKFNFDELIAFYDEVYSNHDKKQIIQDIRAFANETCDMYKVFYGVQEDYLKYSNKR